MGEFKSGGIRYICRSSISNKGCELQRKCNINNTTQFISVRSIIKEVSPYDSTLVNKPCHVIALQARGILQDAYSPCRSMYVSVHSIDRRDFNLHDVKDVNNLKSSI